MNIPIRFKQVKYPKIAGKSTGGMFTKAVLSLTDTVIEIKHERFPILKYIFNLLPIRFETGIREPEWFYINQFNELKIKYANEMKNCEITIKMSVENLGKISGYLANWHKE